MTQSRAIKIMREESKRRAGNKADGRRKYPEKKGGN